MINRFEEPKYTAEKYKFLRKNTVLGPISLMKLSKCKEDLEKFRAWYYRIEGELIDFDYTELFNLEYELRFDAWKRKCAHLWRLVAIVHEDIGLSEFAEIIMENEMARQRRNTDSKKKHLKK